MKKFIFIFMLVLAPLSFADYHGNGDGGGGGGYGSGGSVLAIVGLAALAGGLAYYFTRDARNSKKTEDNFLESKLTNTSNFEIDFYKKEPNNFYNFGSNNLVLPENNLQVNFKYKLN